MSSLSLDGNFFREFNIMGSLKNERDSVFRKYEGLSFKSIKEF